MFTVGMFLEHHPDAKEKLYRAFSGAAGEEQWQRFLSEQLPLDLVPLLDIKASSVTPEFFHGMGDHQFMLLKSIWEGVYKTFPLEPQVERIWGLILDDYKLRKMLRNS